MSAESIFDTFVAIGIFLVAMNAIARFRKPHRFKSGELNSADVATVIRRRQRP